MKSHNTYKTVNKNNHHYNMKIMKKWKWRRIKSNIIIVYDILWVSFCFAQPNTHIIISVYVSVCSQNSMLFEVHYVAFQYQWFLFSFSIHLENGKVRDLCTCFLYDDFWFVSRGAWVLKCLLKTGVKCENGTRLNYVSSFKPFGAFLFRLTKH